MVLISIVYVYAIIGMELFNTVTNKWKPDSPYDGFISDFNSFGGALLMLFQVCTATE
jgi:hypothetical protein